MYTQTPIEQPSDSGHGDATCSTVTVTNARNVPSPPTTANSGSSRPPIRSVPGPRYGRARSGSSLRSRITDRCAIVNDSIAPNAYMLPRKTACPGISVRHAIPPNTTIPIHGVRKRGCSRRRPSGTCRCSPIEYTSRETPMIPALVAMNRIVAASSPT